MKGNGYLKRLLILGLAFVLVLSALLPLQTNAESSDPTGQEIDLSAEGLRIGVESGTVQEQLVQKLYPQAEIVYMDKFSGYTAVAQGKLDCFVFDKKQMEIAVANGLAGVKVLDQTVGESTDIALGISEVSGIENLPEQVNACIAALRADGTLDDMYERWVVQGNESMPEITLSQSPSHHLNVGTTGIVEPYSYYAGTELTGYDIELSYRLAAWLDADVTFEIYDYGSIVAAAKTGKVDVIAADLQVTLERAEELCFSEPLFQEENGIMVRGTKATTGTQIQDEVQGGIVLAALASDLAASAGNHPGGSVPEYQTFEELNGTTISMLTGAPFENLISSKVRNVKEFTYFPSLPDMLLAIKTGKSDAGFMNNAVAALAANRDPELAIFPESLGETAFGLGFAKGDVRSAQWQAAYDRISETTREELWEKWTGADDSIKSVPAQDWPGKNGTVRVAACDSLEPMSYMGENGELLGLDIETILLIAKELDVHVSFTPMDFSAALSSLGSGKADIACGSIVITDERKETMDFVEYLPASYVLIVRAGSESAAYASVDELAGKRIGVVTGTIHDSLVEKRLPTAQIVYFNTIADMLDALKAGKIDAMIRPQSGALFISYEENSITWLDEHLTDADVSFAFPKTEDGAALRELFNKYIRTLRESGELETLREKWFGEDESVKTMIDISALPATNGALRLAATGTQMPFNYVRDDAIVGFEIELAARFCELNGYALQVEQMNFDGVLASVQAEKCDFACACLAVTEERKESVDFSEPHFAESVVFVVLKDTAGQKDSFLDSIRASFEKTFIRENRWKLFLEGVGTTMLITVLSILFGTLLGFAVYMLCRNGNPAANALTRFFVWLVQGMPVVVLLMILYYIIFAKSSIDGTAVAVIGFTLVFGAAVFAMLRAGVGAVDKGQTEAAYALGYGSTRTFFRVILPQAIPHFLPSYKGQITALIKATAVVGYIAVQDLTKMGDIVRGRTYEAFFPLIAVAVIYFILAAILTFIVNRIEIRIDPRQRSRDSILKGVDVK